MTSPGHARAGRHVHGVQRGGRLLHPGNAGSQRDTGRASQRPPGRPVYPSSRQCRHCLISHHEPLYERCPQQAYYNTKF